MLHTHTPGIRTPYCMVFSLLPVSVFLFTQRNTFWQIIEVCHQIIMKRGWAQGTWTRMSNRACKTRSRAEREASVIWRRDWRCLFASGGWKQADVRSSHGLEGKQMLKCYLLRMTNWCSFLHTTFSPVFWGQLYDSSVVPQQQFCRGLWDGLL